MQVKEEFTCTPNSTETEGQKKRKLSTKNLAAHRNSSGKLSAIPLKRQTSLDSTIMIGEFEAAGEELPSGPDLMILTENCNFFNENRSSDDDMLLDQSWSDDMDILLSEETEASPPLMHIKAEKFEIPQASAVQVYESAPPAPAVAAIGAVSAAASDISSVLDSLSPDLRLRFVDRLAEVMGAQLTQSISQHVQVNVQVPQQQQQAQQASQLYVAPTPSYTAPAADPAHFFLPSGCRAPEIALPLASAAIAALLSSMQSFAHNTQMQMHLQQGMSASSAVSVKEEVRV